jgi:hypothetical protein
MQYLVIGFLRGVKSLFGRWVWEAKEKPKGVG